MASKFYLTFCLFLACLSLSAQDTVTVQTLTYDSTGRDYMFEFPEDDGTTYEKIIMEYSMRCKGALVSTPAERNKGCGEWDYSCNTYIVDSTKVDSILSVHPSHIISGFSGTTFDFTTVPTKSYARYSQQEVSVTSSNVDVTATVGVANTNISDLFDEDRNGARAQYLYTSEELTAAGLQPGDIAALALTVAEGNGNVDFLRLRVAAVAATELNAPMLDADWQQVYFRNSSLVEGENVLAFYEDFDWDGTSSLLLDVSYTGDSPLLSLAWGTIDGKGMVSAKANNHLELQGSGHVELSEEGLSDVVDFVTISVWTYGDAETLPVNTSIFEGATASNNRSANVHLPWSNGQIYWDCGDDSGYDRINKTADPSEYEGRWNHWAFTKNSVTGTMKIYLNGELWHSGSNLFRKIDIATMNLGCNRVLSNNYAGKVDEFRLWKTELTQAEIRDWMHRSLDDTHPSYADLVAYYSLDEGEGNTATNTVNGQAGTIQNDAEWRSERGANFITNFDAAQERPVTTFYQGTFDKSVTIVEQTVEEVNIPNRVTAFSVQGTDLVEVSQELVWQAVEEEVINEAGEVVETYPITAEGTVEIVDLDYYRKLPSQFEIMSFVTPYGIYLDLGEEGRTWQFDMTDYTPLLTGSKRMFLGNGGQNQEEMDIKFHFIKGTPPREVIDIQQIWRPSSCNYQNIEADNCFEPREVTTAENGVFFKIRSMVTGHGQEGEFIPRTHRLHFNGVPFYLWQAWTECADNPVYPQGGTWIYDRAGWCPGAATDLEEWSLTELLDEEGKVLIDYDVTGATGDSRYLINHQLVTYGDYNFDLDGAILEVQNPTDRIEYGRSNPSCSDPVVVLQNTGKNTFSSATITYQVAGGEQLTYTWTGELRSMETTRVTLPVADPSFWAAASGTATFTAELTAIDGAVDDYTQNNKYEESFHMPDMVDDDMMVLEFRTNNAGFQNILRVRDFEGNLIVNRSGLASNTTYRDTLRLDDGCYALELSDSGGTGIDFWAVNEGTGYMLLTDGLNLIKRFEPDFGSILRYSFVKGSVTNVKEVPLTDLMSISPNPVQNIFTISRLGGTQLSGQILVTDAAGKTVLQQSMRAGSLDSKVDLSNQQAGVYFCTVITGGKTTTKKIVKL